jgi:SAM-dependent methyltransferase
MHPEPHGRPLVVRMASAAARQARQRANLLRSKVGPWALECPLCGWRCARFSPYGDPPRPHARCPRCGSLERHRYLHFFLTSESRLWRARPLRLLHFAPEPCFEHLRRMPGVDYLSADLVSPTADLHLDITQMPLDDASFDAVLCSHVLEHVDDDVKALKEIFRILRPGGWALVLVPLQESRETTLEDPSVTDPAERRRLFGQHDHVRLYGRDFPRRPETAGFTVECVDSVGSPEQRRRHRFDRELLYLCWKPA